MAIAAAAIAVLSSGVTAALRSARALDMHLGARIVLQSILKDELAAASTDADVREGDSGPYRWRLAIAPTQDGTEGVLPPPFRMYRLSASVAWGEGASVSASVLKLAR